MPTDRNGSVCLATNGNSRLPLRVYKSFNRVPPLEIPILAWRNNLMIRNGLLPKRPDKGLALFQAFMLTSKRENLE